MVLDAITIDCLTLFDFKDYDAKERWRHLVNYEYFNDVDTEIYMDFARRWAKMMQFLLKSDLSNFDKIVCRCAKEANVEHNVRKFHAAQSINLLIDIWKYGDVLQAYIDNGGKDTILNLF
ncbi:MAG: hypothetical protein IKN09_03075 [Clostridia bacterium]|nr:hypothetical protein [Clostridia bacterium]